MGLFNRKQKQTTDEQKDGTRPPTDDAYWTLRSVLNPQLSYSQLLTNPTVSTCVGIISDAIAQLPCIVYRKTADGGRERAVDHPLYKLLKSSPNPEQTTFSFIQQLVSHLLLDGNAYLFIVRAAGMNPQVLALYALDPKCMEIKRDYTTMNIYYRYTVQGATYTYTRDHILHIPAFVVSGLYGLGPLEYTSHVAKTGTDLDEYVANYFNREIQSRLLIDVPPGKKWTKENTREWVDYIMSVYTGKENINKPLFMYDGLVAKPLDLKSNIDSQLNDTLARQEREVAKIFRVPLFMLGKDDAKFANSEQANSYFLRMTLQPWITRIEKHLALLVPSYERDTVYPEFDTNVMLRGDQTARVANYVKEITNGMATLNDINRRENRPILPEAIGDVRFMPVNLMPITAENIEAYMAAQKTKMAEAGAGKVTIIPDPKSSEETK
jgi:HK97 family phage portal protein